MNQGITRNKSLKFAINIVHLSSELVRQNEFILSKQLLRSGTAIGALIREAEYAESSPDFIHKLAIAQKECNETLYWLELLFETKKIGNELHIQLRNEATELMRLLTASIKTKKRNMVNGRV